MSVTERKQRVYVAVGMESTKVIVDGEVVLECSDQASHCDFTRLLDVLHIDHEVERVFR